MEHLQRVQKKTSSMSVTISAASSSALSPHSALLQPVCVSPQTAGGAPYSPQCSGSRGAPSFVKCLHDVSSVKGQLVVLECRLRGTPPLQVLWYREEEQILDSDDFRILRKKASSASVPEELCTLVITEAFPEDSGVYKCVALNSYGSVSCAAILEVYNDLEEQLEVESLRQHESSSLHMSSMKTSEEFPSVLPDPEADPDPEPELEPEPEWPESPPEESLPLDFPEPEPPPDQSPEESERSEVTVREVTPSPPPPPSPPEPKEKSNRLFTPSKLSFTSSSGAMNLSDLPTFSPSSFPSTGFNYERPRHFIQSQPAFQAPSYDSVLQDATPPTTSPTSPPLSPPGVSLQTTVSKTSAQARAALQVSHSQMSHSQVSQSQVSQSQVSQSRVSQSHMSHGQVSQSQMSQNQISHSQVSQNQVSQSQLSHNQMSHSQASQVSQSQVSQNQMSQMSQSQMSQSQVSQSQMSQMSQVLQNQESQMSLSESKSLAQFQSLSLGEVQSNGTSKSSSSSLSSPSSVLLSPSSASPLPRTVRSSLTLTPTSPSATVGLGSASLPANQDAPISAPAAYLCSVLPGAKSPSRSPLLPSRMAPGGGRLPGFSTPGFPQPPGAVSGFPQPTVPEFPQPTVPEFPQPTVPGFPQPTPGFPQPAVPLSPRAPLSPQQNPNQNLQNMSRVQPAVVSLPASYKPAPSILPKPILKKTIAPRPSSARSTDEDIQGSKDALIQDLEKKLRSKEARRRTGQKLSYEERMARRLLGPDGATYMFDQELCDSLDQPDSPEGRHTGGLWGRHHSGADEKTNEGSAIQEKCYAPRFLQIPPDLTVEEGRFCRIDFKVGGLPTPDVSWYLDGKAIRPDDYHKMLVCEKGMHSFIIEIVTVHHAGVYECVAQNRAGESRFSMRLDVIAQEALRPPTFVQKMLNSRALEGDTVRLECKVDASPPPQLFWKKDKDMLRIDPQRMSLYQDGSGRQCLLIERVVKSDAGWYTLSAINEAGMSTCNARLDISSRTTPPMKTAPPASKTLKLLSSLSHVSTLNVEGQTQHTAPLYESEEL